MVCTLGLIAWLSDDVWAAVVGALVEVILGWWALTLYFSRRSDLNAVVEKIDELIEGLAADSAKYWLRDNSSISIEDRTQLEARIKTTVPHILSWGSLIRLNYATIPNELRLSLQDLQVACTGGDFESVGRKADTRRYIRIVNLCHEVERDLHALKPAVWRLFWRHRRVANLR